MSKGNLFLGYARGAVGDVVFSRLDNQQITRARNRAPRNPKTNPQLVQRAFMATILQAYKAGKEIFDHSFQGKYVGAGCMREFMSLNIRKLRAQVASEIAAGTSSADCKARVVGPGTISPVPNEYIISTGTYDQTLFDVDGKMPAPGTGIDTYAKYCEQVGIIDGDYYTIVAFAPNTNEEEVFAISGERDYGARQFPGVFAFVRLTVKSGLTTSTDALPQNISFNNLFQVDASANFSGTLLAEGITNGISTVDIFGDMDDMAFGIIRSRKDQDLRSNTTLKLAASNPMGITSNFALLAWQQGSVQVGDSSLILEGGNFLAAGRGHNTPTVEYLTNPGTFESDNQSLEIMGLPLITGERRGVEGLVVAINRTANGAQAYCIYEQNGELKRATPVSNGFPGSLSDDAIIDLVKYTIEADGSNSPGEYYCVLSTSIQITIDTLPAYLNSIYNAAFGEDYTP